MNNVFNSENSKLVNDFASQLAVNVIVAVNTTASIGTTVWETIPGHQIIWRYIKASHQNDPYRTLVELILFSYLIWYIFKYRRGKGAVNEVKLTEAEIDELVAEWEPEPFVPELTEFQKMELEKIPVIVGMPGIKEKLKSGKEVTNLSSYNFLGIMNSDDIKEKAVSTLRNYGVGTCGPPGFYGTLDVHMKLEQALADFIGAERGIIYSQGFSTISSAIPAFAKRGDIIVADEGVSLAVQQGITISRSTVHWFKHNDMADLERILEKVKRDTARTRKPVTRRFIVVEGLYVNYGDLCPLPKLLELKHKYKWRLIVDESVSFGVIGKTGKGVTEEFNVPVTEVDMISGSMANVLGGAGGFVVGSEPVINHQRLSGQAYCYSASLPAILAVAANGALDVIARDGKDLVKKLKENTVTLRNGLQAVPGVVCGGVDSSPLIHLRLKERLANAEEEERFLQQVVDEAMNSGVLLSRSKYNHDRERLPQTPSIRVCATAALSPKETAKSATVIKEAFRKVFARRK
ncbi:serine palmitoyltransferase component [Gonapodya sp. JEL0774]|nr:serine palmitoyltransferase component [Gonapodya sp. JEL0774]